MQRNKVPRLFIFHSSSFLIITPHFLSQCWYFCFFILCVCCMWPSSLSFCLNFFIHFFMTKFERNFNGTMKNFNATFTNKHLLFRISLCITVLIDFLKTFMWRNFRSILMFFTFTHRKIWAENYFSLLILSLTLIWITF